MALTTMHEFAPNPFNKLPIETNQHIASYFDDDRDIGTFRILGRGPYDAIDGDNLSFWRRRFHSQFDSPGWRAPTNVKFKQQYQRRKMILKNGAIFYVGDTHSEMRCLELLRDLIKESFSSKTKDPGDATYESSNLIQLKRFLKANNLLQIIFMPPKRTVSNSTRSKLQLVDQRFSERYQTYSLLHTIQTLCAPMLLSFEPHIIKDHWSFPDSMEVVYSHPRTYPLFSGVHGLEVNMHFVLHNLNFWKYHMVRESESTLFHPLDNLPPEERPRWWSTQPKQAEQTLGKRWKGSYTFINREEMPAMRNGLAAQLFIQDQFAGESQGSAFQDMHFTIVDDEQPFHWPELFEYHLRSITPPIAHAKTRAQKRCVMNEFLRSFNPLSFRFSGEGQDAEEEFLTTGWINPLPPQHDIPGWKRVTMMKYFEDEDGGGAIDFGALWAYEGVMLPGGQIVLGRWWCIADGPDEMYSGPFILWCVDGPEAEGFETMELEKALPGRD